ncbi:hypothetical protein SAMN05920897_10197 [Alkalispirochaeta americana]|uniref:Uncharacterized protein n=1 Tax=Alkalispirochaeta americana TaxID=159291 RepID=A0A1N6N7J5_9SPIO|nr:hypothetical protein [Alkalispirochaeta americana]SIP88050.1 hypothetical protein SAMN05920897_10197 [Alkalispirochaeta americana]
MFIFQSRLARQEEVISALVDGELPPEEEELLRRDLPRKEGLEERMIRHRALQRALSGTPPESDLCDEAQKRVHEQVFRTLRVRPFRTPWWQQSLSVPLPVASAAVAVFLLAGLLATGLFQGASVPGQDGSARQGLAGLSLEDRNIHVQVNVDATQTEQFLQWLNDQGQAQQLTIQLPEQARFQFRGDPVMVRRDPVHDLEILPLDEYTHGEHQLQELQTGEFPE